MQIMVHFDYAHSDRVFEWHRRLARTLWGPAKRVIQGGPAKRVIQGGPAKRVIQGGPDISDTISVLRLIRKGQVYDTAEVRRIGTGSLPIFYGLQHIYGTPYNRFVEASRFALGDSIEIDIPDAIDPVSYWNAMQDT